MKVTMTKLALLYELNLGPMQYAIYYMKDKSTVVVANVNIVGGICDDCKGIDLDDVTHYEIFTVSVSENS